MERDFKAVCQVQAKEIKILVASCVRSLPLFVSGKENSLFLW